MSAARDIARVLLLGLGLALAGCAASRPAAFPQLHPLDEIQAPVGNVVLQVQPPDAEVVVDGVPQGLARDFDGVHGALTLSAGPHRLVLRLRGYQSYESTVFASDEGREVLQVALEKS